MNTLATPFDVKYGIKKNRPCADWTVRGPQGRDARASLRCWDHPNPRILFKNLITPFGCAPTRGERDQYQLFAGSSFVKDKEIDLTCFDQCVAFLTAHRNLRSWLIEDELPEEYAVVDHEEGEEADEPKEPKVAEEDNINFDGYEEVD